jgi:hypothetical protein
MTDTGPPFREVREHQMRHGGELGPYGGRPVVWTGEATFIRPESAEELPHEPVPYRDAWAMAPPGSSRPVFIRLVIDSYARPQELGEGEVLVMSDERLARGIREGDQVSVLGRIAGADNDVMGYLIVFGDAFRRWGGTEIRYPGSRTQD